MAITRITALWQGFRGAPGYSNFFFGGAPGTEEDARLAAVAVRNFFFEFNVHIPTGVTISIQPTADIILEASGAIQEQIDFEAPPNVTGAGSGGYSAASGAVVNWNTGAYRNGRRVRGRTFIVPLASASYDANGDLDNAALSDLRDGAAILAGGTTSMPFVVWSRPRSTDPGSAEPVTSATVPDLGAVLRSRRD